ncbi:MAG TPA: hypothetical protein VII01_12140 [Solirubrobacteraceae bacterium]
MFNSGHDVCELGGCELDRLRLEPPRQVIAVEVDDAIPEDRAVASLEWVPEDSDGLDDTARIRSRSIPPPTLIGAIVPSASTGIQTRPHGPIGLLGSDVLSRYGKIAVDYDKSLLILDPPIR